MLVAYIKKVEALVTVQNKTFKLITLKKLMQPIDDEHKSLVGLFAQHDYYIVFVLMRTCTTGTFAEFYTKKLCKYILEPL